MKNRLGLILVLLIFILSVSFHSYSAKKKIVVGFSQVGAESAWRIANTESIISEAKKRGIELIFTDALQKPENQIKALRSFIAQKVNVIGFAPVVVSGFEQVLREAKKAGIPVIIIDRQVNVQDTSLWVTHMGSNFVEEGRRAARFLIEKGYRGNIVEMQGTVGSAPAIDRQKGFAEIMKNHPEFKVIQSQNGDFSRSKGKEVMGRFLKAQGKNIKILYSHNDDMAIGAIQAIEEYGLRPGKDIIIVSIDGIRDAFEAMIEGKLNCTVECNPLLGPQFYDAVEAIMNGKAKTLPRETFTQEAIYPMEVAKEVLPVRKY